MWRSLVFVVLAGCLWVGDRCVECGGSDLDEDADGALFAPDHAEDADCDDFDPTRSPFYIEDDCAEFLGRPVAPDDTDVDGDGTPDCVALAYNGNDDDCDRHDWVDVDGDGFPAMTLAEYEGRHPDAQWPDDRVTPAEDASDVDCDDFDAAIRPSAVERPRDGVDSNCDGDD